MSRVRAFAAAVAIVFGVAIVGPAGAQAARPCGAFRAVWDRGELSPRAEKLEGFVYNDSSCSVTDVRIHIVAVNADGHPIAETVGWVYGDIPAGARGYFAVPLPSMPATAADYRVNVVSFDQITPGRRFDGEQAP